MPVAGALAVKGLRIKNGAKGAALEASRSPLLAERAGSDIADVVAGNADVGERLVGEAAKFAERAAIAHPVLCNADRVHVLFLRMIVRAAPSPSHR